MISNFYRHTLLNHRYSLNLGFTVVRVDNSAFGPPGKNGENNDGVVKSTFTTANVHSMYNSHKSLAHNVSCDPFTLEVSKS